MLYIGRSSTNTAVNEVFYSRFKFNFCFLLRSFSAVKVAPVGWQILSASTTTRAIGAKICCYPLIYLSKKPMSLNSTQWHVDSIAEIISRYNLGITGRKISYYWLFVFDKGILSSWDENAWIIKTRSSPTYVGTIYFIKFIYLENVILLFAL